MFYSITLERLLYSRLINVCRLDLPMPTFMEQNKAHLARSLLSSGVRQNMEVSAVHRCSSPCGLFIVDLFMIHGNVVKCSKD